MKPCPGCLFEAIERLTQMANMRRMGGVKKAIGLLTKDGLIKMTVKEGILDIKLMYRP
jgi:hypothetical protein